MNGTRCSVFREYNAHPPDHLPMLLHEFLIRGPAASMQRRWLARVRSGSSLRGWGGVLRRSGQLFMIVMRPGPYCPFLLDVQSKSDSEGKNVQRTGRRRSVSKTVVAVHIRWIIRRRIYHPLSTSSETLRKTTRRSNVYDKQSSR